MFETIVVSERETLNEVELKIIFLAAMAGIDDPDALSDFSDRELESLTDESWIRNKPSLDANVECRSHP